MLLTNNTEKLRLILNEINSLPNRSENSGNSVQTKVGTFTANGAARPFIDIECGFSPDVVFVSLPDSYMNYNINSQNDICLNMTTIEDAETNENAVIVAAGVSGYENDDEENITMTSIYAQKLTTGFRVYAIYEQETNGSWEYTTKTYSYTAIKFNDESDVSIGNGWIDGVVYNNNLMYDVYVNELIDGRLTSDDGFAATDYLPCEGVSDIIVLASSSITQTWESPHCAFYDKNKVFICSFYSNNYVNQSLSIVDYNRSNYDDSFTIPSNAAYVRFSHGAEWMEELMFIPVYNGWVDGVPYTLSLIPNVYIEENGLQVAYNGWSATDYLPCKGVDDIVVDYKVIEETYLSEYCAFYDENKQFLSKCVINNLEDGSTLSLKWYNSFYYGIDIPENAAYVRFSHQTVRMQNYTFTPVKY